MVSQTFISVVMPCYNEEKTVNVAVASILEQTHTNFELLVVDDGSTDKTPEILALLCKSDSRIRIITNNVNLGYSGSINRGIKFAKGQYIARMDADDKCFPLRLEKQIEFLIANPEIGLVGTAVRLVMKGTGQYLGEAYKSEFHDEILKNRYSQAFNFHPSTMGKKDLFQVNGGYDETIRRGEELDLWLRASIEFRFHNLPEVLLEFAVNKPGNIKPIYWWFGVKVRFINMLRRQEFLSNFHHLLIFTAKFFARKYLKLTPRYISKAKEFK